jgi:sensor histidine kinase YesM
MGDVLLNANKVFDKFVGSSDVITLEHRFLNIFALAGAMFCFLGVFISIISGNVSWNVLFQIFAGSILVIGLYLSLKVGKIKLLYFMGVYFVSCILLPTLWIMDGGIRTTIPYFVIFQAVFLGTISIRSKTNLHLYLYLSIFGILIMTEYFRPEYFNYTLDKDAMFIDYTGSFFIVAIFSYYTVRIITKEYVRKHELLIVISQENIELAKASEQAFLHAQIKPHFLYNALNIIAECCSTDGLEAERLIILLSKYLRGTLDFDNLDTVVSLEHELIIVSAYVEIEKARFEELTIHMEVEPDIYAKLPPMTIQPLVENAIKHGIKNSYVEGIIRVNIRTLNDNVKISVIDNGQGIAKKEQTKLLKKEKSENGVGLFNINKRLEALYGNGLVIESEEGVGTMVSFVIFNV